jgi:hypothetical protein
MARKVLIFQRELMRIRQSRRRLCLCLAFQPCRLAFTEGLLAGAALVAAALGWAWADLNFGTALWMHR